MENEENRELLKKYLLNNDADAREQLCFNNEKLVIYFLNRYLKPYSITEEQIKEDYIDLGYIGLLEAINTFDINKIDEVAFSTYLGVCIKSEIYKYFRENNKNIKTISIFNNNEEDVEEVDIEENMIDTDNDIENFIEKDYELYKKKKIEESINTLNDRDKEIIEFYYGLNGKEKLNQQQIADKYNISRGSINRYLFGISQYLAFELKEFEEEYVTKSRENNKLKSIYRPESLSKIKRLYKEYGVAEVNNAIKRLSKEDNKLAIIYYGINDKKEKSIKDLAKKLAISDSIAKKKVINMINKLTNSLKKTKKSR